MMRKLAVVLGSIVLALPLYATGFWMSVEPGMSTYSHGDWRLESEADAWNGTRMALEIDAEGRGAFYDGGLSAGMSFRHLLVGIGLDYSAGSGNTVFKSRDTITGDTVSTWKAQLLTFKLPLAYRIGFRNFSLVAGLYPSYNRLNFRDTLSDSVEVFRGFGYGAFLQAHYMFGNLGIGGSLLLNYIPELKLTEEGYDPDLGNYRTDWIFKDNFNVILRLGVFYTTELLWGG